VAMFRKRNLVLARDDGDLSSCNLGCANQVEILWLQWVDSKPTELVTLEGFEDGRGRICASPHRTENAPLRRKCGSVFDN